MAHPLRIVGYLRCSTEEQAEGASLGDQEARVRAWASLHDAVIVTVEADPGVTGSTLRRPGLEAALGRLRAGEADALVVASLDRLTRSVRDLGELLDGPLADAGLVVIRESIDTTSAAGRLVANLLASVSQWERERLVERTVDALGAMKRRGERTGGVPYGSRVSDDGVHLEPERGEQAAIERARALRAAGESLRAIASTLSAEGFAPRGRRWHPGTLARLLRAA